MFKSAEAIFLVQFLEYLSESYLMVQSLSHCNQIGDNLTKVIAFGGCNYYCHTICKLSLKKSKEKQPVTDLVHIKK